MIMNRNVMGMRLNVAIPVIPVHMCAMCVCGALRSEFICVDDGDSFSANWNCNQGNYITVISH